MQRESPVPDTVLAIGYSFTLVLGYLLDDLGRQGLDLWRDDQRRWHWRWLGTRLTSRAGIGNLGEAVIDALEVRFVQFYGLGDRDPDQVAWE